MDDGDYARESADFHLRVALRQRHDENTWECNGYCMDCGEKISEERLKAMPNAIRCIKCQQIHEANRGYD
jgi:DnaK suppressor protein